MKPIPGETVLSIIHGPATTGHLTELSHFLRRPIDVWAQDRLMLIGGDSCDARRPCRLNLAHRKARNGSLGHFTLLTGNEPRNPDANCHPQDCAFDAISDQTGYPASLLRQVVAQRMLVKLYRSRLRGRDHKFQCSSCNVSGGMYVQDAEMAQDLIELSKQYDGRAHAFVYKSRAQCQCSALWNPTLETIDCIKGYCRVRQRWKRKPSYDCFESDEDLYEILAEALNSESGQQADYCLLDPNHDYRDVVGSKCCPFPTGYHRFVADVACLKKHGRSYFTTSGHTHRWPIGRVEVTLKNPFEKELGARQPKRVSDRYYVYNVVPQRRVECRRI